MRKFTVVLSVLAFFGQPLMAQQPPQSAPHGSGVTEPLPPNAPTREEVWKMLDALQARKNALSMLEQMRQKTKADMQADLQKSGKDSDPEEQKFVSDLVDGAFNLLSVDEIISAMIPVYQRHYSVEDMRAISAFYSTPAGQRMLEEQPRTMVEVMQAIRPMQMKIIESMIDKFKQHEEEKQKKADEARTSKDSKQK